MGLLRRTLGPHWNSFKRGAQSVEKLSNRKLESYRRAEIVAQASRLMMTRANPSQATVDLWSGAIMDWMSVTGKHKYDTPTRRGRHR